MLLAFTCILLAYSPTSIRSQASDRCPELFISDGSYKINGNNATVHCNDGYDLDGNAELSCSDEARWIPWIPQCVSRCTFPQPVRNGQGTIDGVPDENGLYPKGSVIEYSCQEGYHLMPPGGEYRVCEKGLWTGPYVSCVPIDASCSVPKDIDNGYFVRENSGPGGQRLHYGCKVGFTLDGPSKQVCLEDGTWSPSTTPVCKPTEVVTDRPCPVLPTVPNTYITSEDGTGDITASGVIVAIHCRSQYINELSPCRPEYLRCVNGNWVGNLPKCVLARECKQPPQVSYATMYYTNNFEAYEQSVTGQYPINSQISYRCLPGYILEGNPAMTCSHGGCWTPDEPPTCYRPPGDYYMDMGNMNAFIIAIVSGVGVIVVILMLCLLAVCRKKKSLVRRSRSAPGATHPTAPPRQILADHPNLLHHPDRVALIAFAEGMQNDDAILPTYDEATRDRPPPGYTLGRFYRPHYANVMAPPAIGGRRSRNWPPAFDMLHARHGSFVSHTPSTRSAVDSMGSTDTVAVSENSTNVTLDTVSSHSGSQPASCTVNCGSLASFDTNSVMNHEGAPLLEESELEEIHGADSASVNVMDTHSLSENGSFKQLGSASVE